ncbi:hypothetical protein [Christensenella tenuis]|uniref:Polymer-forming cytoskeletal protein n=1 Tax=Christensenella tenuis TaxID=2763033 RepID=A0ABR7EAU6_9FIRM|nr:hypothetical protein [Christensenella tenuis]MBC5646908.1 hypothetical protein [Christensenella tenuis]
MQNFSFNGKGTMNGGEYSTVIIDGIAECTGGLKAEHLDIDGIFKCAGAVKADVIECDGVAEFSSEVTAKKFSVDGVVKMKRLGADEINCDGLIKAEGEVSADIVRVDGCINAKEIVGDHISINPRSGKITGLLTRKTSCIDLIEATTIHLRGVSAQTVSGKDITIGPHCKIKTVDCNGTLSIDKKAKVENITGEYSLK